MEIDLDRLVSTLTDTDAAGQPAFNSKPPRIFIHTEPIILVLFEGKPDFEPIDDTRDSSIAQF